MAKNGTHDSKDKSYSLRSITEQLTDITQKFETTDTIHTEHDRQIKAIEAKIDRHATFFKDNVEKIVILLQNLGNSLSTANGFPQGKTCSDEQCPYRILNSSSGARRQSLSSRIPICPGVSNDNEESVCISEDEEKAAVEGCTTDVSQQSLKIRSRSRNTKESEVQHQPSIREVSQQFEFLDSEFSRNQQKLQEINNLLLGWENHGPIQRTNLDGTVFFRRSQLIEPEDERNAWRAILSGGGGELRSGPILVPSSETNNCTLATQLSSARGRKLAVGLWLYPDTLSADGAAGVNAKLVLPFRGVLRVSFPGCSEHWDARFVMEEKGLVVKILEVDISCLSRLKHDNAPEIVLQFFPL